MGKLKKSNPMGYMTTMQSVAETPIFTRQTEKLFTEDEKRELIDFLAENRWPGSKSQARAGCRSMPCSPMRRTIRAI